MYYADPVKTTNHIHLMNELKRLYLDQQMNSDLKRVFLSRLTKFLRISSEKHQSIINNDSVNYFSDARIAVYTVIFGQIDHIHEPVFLPDNCDFFIFTDQEVPADSAWQKKSLDILPEALRHDPIKANRYLKFFPDKFFPEYKFTIYMDGKFQARTDLTEFIHDMNPVGLRMFNHPVRDCVFDEIIICQKLGKDNKDRLIEHYKHLKSSGMPQHYGMLEGGIIIRQTGNRLCQNIMEAWWKEFLEHSRRDQISLPFVLWKNRIKIDEIAIPNLNIWTYPAIFKFPHQKK